MKSCNFIGFQTKIQKMRQQREYKNFSSFLHNNLNWFTFAQFATLLFLFQYYVYCIRVCVETVCGKILELSTSVNDENRMFFFSRFFYPVRSPHPTYLMFQSSVSVRKKNETLILSSSLSHLRNGWRKCLFFPWIIAALWLSTRCSCAVHAVRTWFCFHTNE
jgi:hypothetical protein